MVLSSHKELAKVVNQASVMHQRSRQIQELQTFMTVVALSVTAMLPAASSTHTSSRTQSWDRKATWPTPPGMPSHQFKAHHGSALPMTASCCKMNTMWKAFRPACDMYIELGPAQFMHAQCIKQEARACQRGRLRTPDALPQVPKAAEAHRHPIRVQISLHASHQVATCRTCATSAMQHCSSVPQSVEELVFAPRHSP